MAHKRIRHREGFSMVDLWNWVKTDELEAGVGLRIVLVRRGEYGAWRVICQLYDQATRRVRGQAEVEYPTFRASSIEGAFLLAMNLAYLDLSHQAPRKDE